MFNIDSKHIMLSSGKAQQTLKQYVLQQQKDGKSVTVPS